MASHGKVITKGEVNMLLKQTEDLLHATARLKERFLNNEPPKNLRDYDYFLKVKNETEPLFELIEKWEDEALKSVKNRDILVHPQQIESTRENFELIIMHSYYIDVKPKRYMELQQAIDYVCQLIK